MKDPASFNDRPESRPGIIDTREIVRRHMQDAAHIITDEEMQQITITTDHINISEHPIVKAVVQQHK